MGIVESSRQDCDEATTMRKEQRRDKSTAPESVAARVEAYSRAFCFCI